MIGSVLVSIVSGEGAEAASASSRTDAKDCLGPFELLNAHSKSAVQCNAYYHRPFAISTHLLPALKVVNGS